MTYDVIIIGGGMSGLVAARELVLQGAKVLLLEARQRLGGQIFSFLLSDSISGDAGAMYLHGRGTKANPNPIFKLLERYQISSKPIDSLNAETFGVDHKPISLSNLYEKLKDNFDEVLRLIEEAKKIPYHTPPTIDAILNFTSNDPIKNDPINKGSLDYWAKKLMTASITNNTGAPLNDLSLLNLMNHESYEGSDEIVLGGYQQLIEKLYQEASLSQNLTSQLNSPVTRVYHFKDELQEVYTVNGEQYKSLAVLCTVPINILKQGKLSFRPSLSPAKQQALHHFKMGQQNKVFLEFEKPFFDTECHFIYPDGQNNNYWPEYFNLYPFTGRSILVAHFYGDQAIFKDKSDEEITNMALEPLKRVFPKTVIDLKKSFITHWDEDEYSEGSGVYCNAGCQEKHIEALDEPEEGGLFFANAYKRFKQGDQRTVEGAFHSGMEEALKISIYLKNVMQKDKTKKMHAPTSTSTPISTATATLSKSYPALEQSQHKKKPEKAGLDPNPPKSNLPKKRPKR